MRAKYRKTVEALFTKPTKANIKFGDIELLVKALGAEVREGAGAGWFSKFLA